MCVAYQIQKRSSRRLPKYGKGHEYEVEAMIGETVKPDGRVNRVEYRVAIWTGNATMYEATTNIC